MCDAAHRAPRQLEDEPCVRRLTPTRATHWGALHSYWLPPVVTFTVVPRSSLLVLIPLLLHVVGSLRWGSLRYSAIRCTARS